MYAEPWEPWLVKLLTCAELLVFPALLLGYSKRGCPIWPDARALFVPAGAALVAHSLLIAGRIDPRYAPLDPLHMVATIGMYALGGVALLGAGANHIHRAAGFRALVMPICACFALWGATVAVRGRAAVPPSLQDDPRWRFPRAIGAIGAITCTLGAAAAVGLIHLSPGDCA
jgi:hypothetical protein